MRLTVFGLFAIVIASLLIGCTDPANSALGSDKSIKSFGFLLPAANGVVTESTHTIAITLPFGTPVGALVPTIVHTGTRISPESGLAQDFTNPVIYTVTAADGSTQSYMVTVTVAPFAPKAITAFSLSSPPAQGVITESTHTIVVTVPSGTNITSLVPTIVHTGSSINPASGIPINFSGPMTYTVMATDGTSQVYTVTVTVASSAAKEITAFSLASPPAVGVITESTHSIAVTVPYGTALTALSPTIYHTGANISPASGTAQNFTSPLTYTVWAADGSSQAYAVTVTSMSARIINHTNTNLDLIPATAIQQAKANLHVAYGHTSHGSQLIDGIEALDQFKGGTGLYAAGANGTPGALDLRDYAFGPYGANDLGAPDFTAWETATRSYLAQNTDINVVMWSWCGEAGWATEAQIQTDMELLTGLITDFPAVQFVFMTGHLDGTGAMGNLNLRNEQIRQYCTAHGYWLYDFADIESYDPDGVEYMTKLANDGCDFDSDGDGTRDANWATAWQNAHPGQWYSFSAAHTIDLNGNLKEYAAWWLWARLAGWGG